MPLDGIFLKALTEELHKTLASGRVDKIYQPDKEEIVLSIRAGGNGYKLMLTANPSAPRMHLISMPRENPAAPPMFCMLLRKHLGGAKLCGIVQPELERMAVLEFDTTDEMGVQGKKYLICEMMGKYSNLILCDGEKRILDAIRRIDGDISGKRQVLPGLFYRMPPGQDKVSVLEVSEGGLQTAILQSREELPAEKWILSRLKGISPLISRELAVRALGDGGKRMAALTEVERNCLCRVAADFRAYVRDGKSRPYLLLNSGDGSVFDVTYLPVTQYGSLIQSQLQTNFSVLLGAYYEKKGKAERMRRKSQDMTKTVTLARDRLRKKLEMQKAELAKTRDREQYKRKGELITANLYQIRPGQTKAMVVDYFAEDCPEVEITLDIRLTPQQNAARYFKQYSKAKTAEEMLTAQIAEGEQNFSYLESVLEEISRAESEQDLSQIRSELYETGYLSQKQKRGQPKKSAPGKPYAYRTSDGFPVFAGRNNTQNDLLTLKTAFKNDIWFHTQKIHGSHVILVCDNREPTDTAMTEAACIAAYHSKARSSAMVPVDYTKVKNIKKPAGAKPGMVIYHVYQTAYVTPKEESILALRQE